MNIKDKLSELQKLSHQLFRQYETMITEFENSDFVGENEKLRQEVVEQKSDLARTEAILQEAMRENDRLRLTLQEQILDEKLNLVKISRQKLETYFADQASEYNNQLTDLEMKTKRRLFHLKEAAQRNLIPVESDFYTKLAQLEHELDGELRAQAERFREAQQQLKAEFGSQMDSMAAAEITPEILVKRAKQNQWEMKVGLNWINKIGILLILFGVGAVFNYSYHNWMNDYMKGICFFILGGLFLTGGEWFYRKRKTVFSMGLLGGGIAILYGSIFYSYFTLKIIHFDLGLGLSIIVTLLTAVLSIRYNSATVGSLGLIGGYLPFLSLVFIFGGLSLDNYLAVMGYLLLLNLLMLLISFWKKWNTVSFLSFFLNLPAIIYIVFNTPNLWVGIIYSILTFLMYLAITLAYPLKHKTPIKIPEVILLGLNTLANSLIVFLLFQKAGFGDYRGLMALMFCLIYLGMGRFIQKNIQNELRTLVLFYATALTFAILIIPFQFGVRWLSLGWLVEGILLAVYGCRAKLKSIERAGWGIFLLCLASFGLIDYLPQITGLEAVPFFDLKYLWVTVGQILLLAVYLREIAQNQISGFSRTGKTITYYKYFTVFSTWIYLDYTATTLYQRWMPQIENYLFYQWVLIALITMGLGYLILHLKILFDRIIKGFALFLFLLGDLICIGLNLTLPVLKPVYAANTVLEYLALLILIIYNLFVFLNIRSLIIKWISGPHGQRQSISLETYPLLLGIYLIGNITAFFIVQFHFGALNLLFSLIYLVAAIGFIVYGFMRRFIYIRRLGLGLTLLATAKLFIYDLSFLNNFGKILAYFGFGIVLLVISFIYQKVKNTLEDEHAQSRK